MTLTFIMLIISDIISWLWQHQALVVIVILAIIVFKEIDTIKDRIAKIEYEQRQKK